MKKKDFLKEAGVPGLKVTDKVNKISKKSNDGYYKDVTKKMKDYDGDLKGKDKDAIDPVKHPGTDKDKEYHEDMEIMNGQEMIEYDREPSEAFKDRAKKAITGDSTMGNKTYTGKENGNTESVWGASDDKFGEKLLNTIKRSDKKRDDAQPTINQFGDDIETGIGEPRRTKRPIATESMKRIKFKKPFNGVGNALKLIPEQFKVNDKKFELTDGNEKYTIQWKGSVKEGKAIVLDAGDKTLVSEDFSKIKHLMGYKSEDTLGTLSGEERQQADKALTEGLKRNEK